MKRAILIALMLTAHPTLAVEQCITVTTDQAQQVAAAKDSFNARTGQSLSAVLWVKYSIRAAVLAELARSHDDTLQTTVEAAKASYEGAIATAEATRRAAVEAELGGWVSPTPTPQPTATPTPTETPPVPVDTATPASPTVAPTVTPVIE